jgi:hypothetical protein
LGIPIMTRITISHEQAKLINKAEDDIVLVDPSGNEIGLVSRPTFTREDIEDALKRANSGGPWYTTAEVLAHLRALAPECPDTP